MAAVEELVKRQGQEIVLDLSTVDWNVQGAFIFLFSNKSFDKATWVILLCLEDVFTFAFYNFFITTTKKKERSQLLHHGFKAFPTTQPVSLICRIVWLAVEEIPFSELHLYSPNETETDSCDAPACWTEFSEWSACEGMCGSSGSQSRTRSCIEPTEGGQPCPEESTETATQECNTTGLWASALNQPPM